MDIEAAPPTQRSVTFRALKYILIAVLVLLIILIILGFIGFFMGIANNESAGGTVQIAVFIIDGLIGFIAAIVGLIGAFKERHVPTIASGAILIILAVVNFVLGVHWLDIALYLIGGVIAICFAVWIKKEVRVTN